MGRTITIIILAAAIVAVSACATSPPPKGAARGERVVIKPGGIYEGCRRVAPGQSLIYSFHASMPVSFNLHYHHEKMILYPIKKDRVVSDQGSFSPETEYKYCLMWQNFHGRPVTMTVRMEVTDN